MSEVVFIYNGKNINIRCNKDDKLKDICEKFINESQIDKDSIYYLHNGEKINEKLTFRNMVNNKKRKKIKIVVKLNEELNKNKINKSKDIICPICKESIRIIIEDYKIKLYECKNNHIIDKILLDEFEDTQNIDMSEILCEI